MSDRTPGKRSITRKDRQLAARKLRQRQAEAKRLAAEVAAAEAEELRAEGIAPAVQRLGVPGVQQPRVEPDGKAFRVANPIARLARVSSAITAEHVTAAGRLVVAWEEGGRGIGMGASCYGERTSGGEAPGMIGERVLAALRRQNAARDEFGAAQRWCGRLWAPLVAVVLVRTDVSTWALATGRDRKAAVGYVAAALDRLAEFYAEVDAAAEKVVGETKRTSVQTQRASS